MNRHPSANRSQPFRPLVATLLLTLLAASCEREPLPVPPDNGDVNRSSPDKPAEPSPFAKELLDTASGQFASLTLGEPCMLSELTGPFGPPTLTLEPGDFRRMAESAENQDADEARLKAKAFRDRADEGLTLVLYQTFGVAFELKEGKLWAVTAHLRPHFIFPVGKHVTPYDGNVAGDISGNSRLKDVVSRHGAPRWQDPEGNSFVTYLSEAHTARFETDETGFICAVRMRCRPPSKTLAAPLTSPGAGSPQDRKAAPGEADTAPEGP